MILRRLAEAITEQNWFTVVLEVLIVVVGIFIGLQVDDWNEARKDRAREIEYLQRIDNELAEDITQFELGLMLAERRGGYANLVIGSVENPEVVRRDPTGFIRAFHRAGFTYSPIISDHTFEEIKSAGELGIIRKVELRSAITGYYQEVRQYGQWNYVRELMQTEYIKRQAGVLTPRQIGAFWGDIEEYEVTEQAAMAAYERMLAKPAFIDWLPIAAHRSDDLAIFGRARKRAENLRVKIAEAIGETADISGETH